MQGKTQVYGLGASDYYRSRLTHSIEVAQIGRALADKLGANPDLTEAICLAHDIGHPPFGHAGESVLHQLLRDWGGFNGNAQNLRIVAVLEQKYADLTPGGLNLTHATLDGLVKYPNAINPFLDKKALASKKGFYQRDAGIVGQFKPHTTRKTFECELMNWADDIAYSSHDLEDALVIGTIRRDDLEQKGTQIAEHAIDSYAREYPGFAESNPLVESDANKWIEHILDKCVIASANSGSRQAVIKEYVSAHIDSCVFETAAEDVDEAPARYSKTIKLNSDIVKKVEIFKAVVFVCVIRTPAVYTLQHAGMRVLSDLFEALTNVSNDDLIYLFPMDARKDADAAVRAYRGGTDRARIYELVRDFLASMTDANCEATWRRMFAPGGGLFTARV